MEETQENSTGGNNHPPSDFRSRKYVFTLNNYTDSETQEILSYLKRSSRVFCFGEEVGEKGTPHLQGYMEFKSQKKWSVICEQCTAFGRAWSTTARGNLLDNYNYTTKDGKYYHGGFNATKLTYKVTIENLYDWEKEIIEILAGDPDDRTIHWYWEPKGCAGKTTFQKYIYTNYKNVVVLSGKSTDMKNGIINVLKETGETPDIVLINIPRCNYEYVSYEGIESIKDMFFFSGKYEGGMVCGKPPFVLIFANEKPIEEKLSKDRWSIKRI